MKALIIGGGIGGVSAAIALLRSGIEAVVFEQADALREVGAGLSLWTNAVEALRKLGAEEAVLATGSILERFEARTSQGDLLAELPSASWDEDLERPMSWFIAQNCCAAWHF